MTLQESVDAAVKENPPVETKVEETKVEETKQEETKQETKEELTPEQIAYNEKVSKAVRLFDALSDKDIGPGVIRTLAEKAGVMGVQEGKTEKQITKTVVETLKESLGPEYEFLADRLATGIDKIVKQTVAEQILPVQQQTNEAVARAIEADVNTAFEKFQNAHKDAKELDTEMTALSKKLPYDGSYPLEDYLEYLYKIVTTDKKEAKIVKQTVDKINKNAQELRDSSTEVQETRVAKGSKLPSLNEAVQAAFKGERLI